MIVLYHRTTEDAADDILKSGFQDTTGRYLTTNTDTLSSYLKSKCRCPGM